jgi:hypothetical protein
MEAMNDVDRAACERAIEIARADPDSRMLIEALLARGDSFEEVGQTAAYHCQCASLHLRPWQPPPMYATPRLDGPDDGIMGRHAADVLLCHLFAAGLSKYEPDPLKAIEQAERERATKTPPRAA